MSTRDQPCRLCAGKSLRGSLWLSEDLRLLHRYGRVFPGDVSDYTFLYVTA